MTNQTLLATLGLMAVSASLYMSSPPTVHTSRLLVTSPEDAAWTHWKMTQGRVYGTSTEEIYRKNVFKHHYNHVALHNADSTQTFKKALNKFADLEPLEWKKTYASGFKKFRNTREKNIKIFNTEDLPSAIDYSDAKEPRGKRVTDVKDQGQCGSCWTFSSTGNMEGQIMHQHKDPTPMSEQQLIDCHYEEGSDHNGCDGGLMSSAFEYWKTTPSVSEDQYQYTGEDNQGANCKTGYTNQYTVKDVYDVTADSPTQLKACLRDHGPTSIAIEADAMAFQLYKSGVITKNCGDDVDHAVLAAGYGIENIEGVNTPYWKVKNSWGSQWGENGYVRIGTDQCGSTQMALTIVGTAKATS